MNKIAIGNFNIFYRNIWLFWNKWLLAWVRQIVLKNEVQQ
jgi:hypothetical protein